MPVNPLFRQTTIAAPENPYARLGFRCNPFPEKPGVIPGSDDPRSNGTIYVATTRAKSSSDSNDCWSRGLIDRCGRWHF